MRKSFIVEFTGTPEAGKTTTINALEKILPTLGHTVTVSRESAEILPIQIPKGTPNANLWMHYRTQAGLLESLYNDSEILLVDRGLVDSNFYGKKFLWEGSYTKKEYEMFKTQFNKNLFPNLVIALMVPPEISIKRKGKQGRLVNMEYVTKYNDQFLKYFEEIISSKVLIDTSELSVDEMIIEILSVIISNYKNNK